MSNAAPTPTIADAAPVSAPGGEAADVQAKRGRKRAAAAQDSVPQAKAARV